MAYDLNSLIRMKDLKVLAQMIKAELQNSGGGSGGGSMEWPDNDDKYYAAKNGAWVEVTPAIMIETETGALPSDKYPLAFKVIAETGTDSSSYTYNLWNDGFQIAMFNYNGMTYALGSYVSGSGSSRSFHNYLYTVNKKTGYSQKNITPPTTNALLFGAQNSTFLFLNGYLYISVNNKIYTLNIGANASSLVELDSGYKAIQVYSFCYSPKLDLTLLIYNSGYVQTMSGTPGNMTYSTMPTTVNPELREMGNAITYKAVWSDELEIFCVGGTNGTAVSSDGLNWTSQLNIGDLRHITWVAEHHCFYAWKGNVPCMSSDGLTWVEMTAHALPNTNTNAPAGMTYVPELGIFCISPAPSSAYILISNDLKSFAKVDIPAGSNTYGIFWDSDNKRLLTTRDIKKGTSTYYTQSILALEF